MFKEVGFLLDIDEDGWPPVAVEWLYVTPLKKGVRIENAPLYVKGLSVGDVVVLKRRRKDNLVIKWEVLSQSDRSVIWVLTYGDYDPSSLMGELRNIGCNTAFLEATKIWSIDVPGSVAIADVDQILKEIDRDRSAIAYPSYRHGD